MILSQISVNYKYQDFDPSPTLNRLVPIPSQVLSVSLNGSSLNITLDTGATVSYITFYKTQQLKLSISPNDQLALLADKKTRMASLGEVDFTVAMGSIKMRVRALVMKNLQAECFGGTTFHADNDISARVKTGDITIHNKFIVKQSNLFQPLPLFPPLSQENGDSLQDNSGHVLAIAQQIEAVTDHPIVNDPVLDILEPTETHGNLAVVSPNRPAMQDSAAKYSTISLPKASLTFSQDYLQIPLPIHLTSLHYLAIIPSFPSIPAKVNDCLQWTPQVCEVVHGKAIYQNFSKDPIFAPKYAHFKTQSVDDYYLSDITSPCDPKPRYSPLPLSRLNTGEVHPNLIPAKTLDLLSMIKINDSILSPAQLQRLTTIHRKNYKVFDNDLTGGYNHKSGQFYAEFTFNSKPPPTRVFVPQFNKKCSSLQQAKCDELESQGVLVDPKAHGIPVLHVSPIGYSRRAGPNTKTYKIALLTN